MKKKIILSLLVIVTLFAMTGCGKNNNSGKTYSLGDTVKTDIISFKLTAGEFTYALVNTNGDEFAMPKEYNAEVDNKNPYVAAKGHTLAAFTFYVENLDRSSIDIGGSFNSLKCFFFSSFAFLSSSFICPPISLLILKL